VSVCGRRGVSRRRGRRKVAPIAFGALLIALLPNKIGFQDLGALLASQPAVANRWHQHLIASPFGTIHAATFSMPRPIGTAIPHPPIYALANFDPNDITGSIGSQPLGDETAPLRFPTVNRKAKGDSRASRAREPLPPLPEIEPLPQASASPRKDEAPPRFDAYSKYELPDALDTQAPLPDIDLSPANSPPIGRTPAAPKPGTVKDASQVYFGTDPMTPQKTEISPWTPGEAPIVLASRGTGDPDMKEPSLSPGPEAEGKAGETIANKGEVTGENQRPYSPAERLGLSGESLVKAQKCLTSAIYFEARGEAVRGQIAVAQVIINRTFSPFYPHDVCGVVYQNADRRNACQFSFACDGIPDVVTEPDAWARAQRIARDMIDGKLWMPEVGKATHYHAYWVHPDWINEMKKIYKLGVHAFYRPLTWGDGDDEPTWGDPVATEKEAAKEEIDAPPNHSLEWLRSEDGQAWKRQHAAK
jgi:spore germination cell wall hydrolase CwlJ-like protein